MPGPGRRARAASQDDDRPPPVPAGHKVEVLGPAPAPASVRRDELQQIDGLMGSVLADAAAGARVDPATRPGPAFREDTQALLDHLEHLGEMREKGLLAPEEYETAKGAVMHELEARS